MPMGKEVSGCRGHLRPAWERLAPEGLNYCRRGTSSIPGRRAADSSSRAARGVLSQGTASCPPLTPITETWCLCERGAPCSEEPVGWDRPAGRGQPQPCDATSPPSACPQTVRCPSCQEPTPLLPGQGPPVPITGSECSREDPWGRLSPGSSIGSGEPSEEKWGTTWVPPGPRAVQTTGNRVWVPPESAWACRCVPLSTSISFLSCKSGVFPSWDTFILNVLDDT